MDVERIAKGLTKAQARTLLAMKDEPQRAREIPASGSTLMSLWDYGRDFSTTETAIAPPVMLVTRDTWDDPLCYVWQIEPLGVTVRDYLLASRGRA